MPRISIILATARDDYPLIHAPDWHLLGGPAACLREQTFQDFEWIVVDLGHEKRRTWFDENPQPFPVTHVPPKPNYWLERGKRAVCACRNTGAALATGELLVFFDDAWTLPPDFLEMHWSWYERGYLGAALYKTAPAPGDAQVWNDCRYGCLVDGVFHHEDGVDIRLPATHGGVAVDRPTFDRIGGWNEVMDASWALEDIELGWRIQAAGGHVVLDESLFIVAHDSHGLVDALLRTNAFTLCCQPVASLMWERVSAGEIKAGRPIAEPERNRYLLPRCTYWRAGNCDLYGPEHPCPQVCAVVEPDVADPHVRRALSLR